jgi:hypothetical protein
MKVIALARYAFGLARDRVDLSERHICKRAHVTRTVSQRAYRQWEVTQTVRCRCGRPAHPIHARGAR